MDKARALGVWHSSFGPVKIELDDTRGDHHLMGVWVYKRGGGEVIGYFAGALRGNVLEFDWHEPAQPKDLTGKGYLVFSADGSRFNGRWWTKHKDRQGAWNGHRGQNTAGGQPPPAPYPGPTEPGATAPGPPPPPPADSI